MVSFLRISFILVLWSFIDSVVGQTCRYSTICSDRITINKPCNRLPECREIFINKPCIRTQDCTEYKSEWTSCSQPCGPGIRERFGRCCGSRCVRVIRDTESCNLGPCATPPPPPPTSPPPPPSSNNCQSIPCANNGQCTSTQGGFTCDCTGTGFEGDTCNSDVNECSSSPCNGGSCTNTPGSFTCDCTGTGFEGDTCSDDVNECSLSPCNGGSCTNTPGSFTCDCTGTGFEGDTCSDDVNECSSSPCNGGSCTNTPGSFTCDCTGTGFEGDTCSDADGNWSQWSSWVATTCTQSCCGGTQDRTRTRTCTDPPPAGNGATCPGADQEDETAVACNTQDCPLSCVTSVVGDIFNDPCLACSNRFFACDGSTEPTPFNCPSGNVWSPMNSQCQETCDP